MIDIEIPGLPPLLLNSRMHWRKAMKLKNEWYQAVAWAVREKRLPGEVEPYRFSVVHYTRFAPGKEPDQTNLATSFKWIEDGLVRCGVLEDDSPSHVQNYYHWQRARTKDKRVRIIVSPVPHL